jgi:multidrug efflux pump
MTTAAMVVAMIPLILAEGAGAKSRFDIGLVIAFGMTIGTIFTLFVTPAVYTYLARDHRSERKGGLDPQAPAPVPAAPEPPAPSFPRRPRGGRPRPAAEPAE